MAGFQCVKRSRESHGFSADIKARLRALSQLKDNWHAPLALCLDLFYIGLSGWACIACYRLAPIGLVIIYPMAALIIGTRQRGLGHLLHDGTHRILCRTRCLETLVGMISGWLILQTFARYLLSHRKRHHPYLGDEVRDPDIANYVRQGLFKQDTSTFIRNQVLASLLGLKTTTNVSNLVRDRLWPSDWRSLDRNARLEYVAFLIFWAGIVSAAVYTGYWLYLIVFWVIPYLTVFQAVNWLIELTEHFPLTRMSRLDVEMTRNRRGNAIENFLMGVHGDRWHLTHHLHPGIPFWLLAEAHAIMMADPTYARVHERYGGLFVKGPDGQPSILSVIGKELVIAQAASGSRPA
jgi:fatty acid desaturase